jgi:hypothetical protein
MEPHIANEKMLLMKTRQSLTLSGPKNDGIESKVVRTQETMLLNKTRRLKTLSGQDSAGVESEVSLPYRVNVATTKNDAEGTSLDRSPLNSSPRLSEKKQTQKSSKST